MVNKDTDGDGIPDWEESLWGTDPTKKETTPGTPDSVAIAKLKIQEENNVDTKNVAGGTSTNSATPEKLTQTDQFSRELFSTIAATNQSGALDQATVDKISSSLADHTQNSPQRKVYTLSDIKTTKDESPTAIRNYLNTLNTIQQKYPIKNNFIEVLQKFVPDETTVNVDALKDIDPIVKQTTGIVNDMAKMTVPQFLAPSHVDYLNALERLVENVSDIKFYDTDAVVALSAIAQYGKNTTYLETASANLLDIITKKSKN